MTLLSASLVVRNEAQRISGTLAAVRAFVDEVVVHDTGSTDRTVALLRTAGATVLEGTWNDSFAEARNVSLAASRGEWILSIDADETCVGDPTAFRSWLAGVSEDSLAVSVVNTGGQAGGEQYGFTAVRLFRRVGALWQGRVHERVVREGAQSGDLPLQVPAEFLVVEHSGYADPDVVRRKGERNGRLARLELDELMAEGASPEEMARTALKVGRSAVGAGSPQDAVDAFEAVRELVTTGPTWAEATDYLARVLLGAGEASLGIHLSHELERAGVNHDYCRWLRGQGLAQSGRPAEALAELEGVDAIVDTASRRHDPAALEALRKLCRELLAAT